MAVVLITGGTGLLGRALAGALVARGYECIILTRQQRSGGAGLRYASWDPRNNTIDEKALQEADYIIHLAGAGIAEKRWTSKRKQEILDSRVQSGKLLAGSLRRIPNKVKAVISASATGWYGADPGSRDGKPFTEEDPAGAGFLGNTCRQWEESTRHVTVLNKRLVVFRIGIVLSKEGGALKEFLKPLRFGVAAILGSGKQITSWIHIDDLVQLFIYALENPEIKGIYNAVAPGPVSNRELTLVLAKLKKRFYIPLPVPAWLLKLILGEMGPEILKSATVSCEKIQRTGFKFRYPDIHSALAKETTQAR
ncbi:MAG: TIGR01777 family protein [Sphingobacteriales bacterium]|nr:TIGR01777 family protein [Sphingobacteriales bacterium]